jgi:hypothetical protein
MELENHSKPYFSVAHNYLSQKEKIMTPELITAVATVVLAICACISIFK